MRKYFEIIFIFSKIQKIFFEKKKLFMNQCIKIDGISMEGGPGQIKSRADLSKSAPSKFSVPQFSDTGLESVVSLYKLRKLMREKKR